MIPDEMLQLFFDAMDGNEYEPVGMEAWQAWRVTK